MAGYTVHSLDATAFHRLTTAPTMAHSLMLADWALLELDWALEEALDEYDASFAADASLWPLDRQALAGSICRRLASPDWYANLTMGDAVIWDLHVLAGLRYAPGEAIGIDFRHEENGFLYWNAAKTAARVGAPMLADFGNGGFRYFGRSRSELELMYTAYLPPQTRQLLQQLDRVAPHFATLPDEEGGERDQFFRGLLEPVRAIVGAGRVMWVLTDT
jgi:hypothetical protein